MCSEWAFRPFKLLVNRHSDLIKLCPMPILNVTYFTRRLTLKLEGLLNELVLFNVELIGSVN